MNKIGRIVFGIGIVLALFVVFTASAAALPWEGWLDPQDSTGAPGEDTYVEQWVTYDRSQQQDPTYGALAYQVDIHFDPDCVNITSADFSTSPFGGHMFTPYAPGVVRILEHNYTSMLPLESGTYKMYTLTFHAESSGSCACDIWFDVNKVSDEDGEPIANSYTNGTFTCAGPAETFEKELVEGGNLISLPLTPLNSSTSAVLGNDTIEYDAVYRYDATSNQFESVIDGTMDPGIGYFVNVTAAGTWSYVGSPYDSMSIELKQGLNMVGWLNCTKQISGNLTSIAGKYNYNARWNASYEVYEPQAPEVFNDFFDMERGEGYWIAAKENCTLTESCSD